MHNQKKVTHYLKISKVNILQFQLEWIKKLINTKMYSATSARLSSQLLYDTLSGTNKINY